MKKELGFEKAY